MFKLMQVNYVVIPLSFKVQAHILLIITMEGFMKTVKEFEKKYSSYAAYTYMTLACLCFSLYSLMTKLLPHIPPMHILTWRYLVCTAWTFYIGKHYRAKLYVKDGKDHIGLLIISSLSIPSALCWIYGVVYLPLSEATVLSFSQPAFSVILAPIFL